MRWPHCNSECPRSPRLGQQRCEGCAETPSLSLSLNYTHTHPQGSLTLGECLRGHSIPSRTLWMRLVSTFSPEGLGLSFCSGMAEFNWGTLIRSWMAELLLPSPPLKCGGRDSRATVSGCVCACMCVCVCVCCVRRLPRSAAAADIPYNSAKFIHGVRAVCL